MDTRSTTTATDTAATRSVARIVDTVQTLEGGGFPVRRPFPTQRLADFDPFLLLDQMGPVSYPPGRAVGAPDHPHRGFETVTYLLEGSMQHRDSAGRSGKLRPGDVQWMTAGGGVVHSELPDEALLRDGGRMHGFQLWVNLPARDKMMAPRYQDTASERIPVVTSADGAVRVKVIAGEAMGARAVIDTRTPILYLHYTLRPGARVEQPVPAAFNVFAYVFGGAAEIGRARQPVRAGQAALLAADGAAVELGGAAGATEPAEVLLIGGVPLGEPVVRHGPFVMNTEQEIMQAFDDYRSGRMGRIT